ncbi:unnamed protein product [Caenorhabditis sp. 36 PRJEB53466]|nr:unnamed protein product [Caenorhabditis sp. 36 PRJEB53466]
MISADPTNDYKMKRSRVPTTKYAESQQQSGTSKQRGKTTKANVAQRKKRNAEECTEEKESSKLAETPVSNTTDQITEAEPAAAHGDKGHFDEFEEDMSDVNKPANSAASLSSPQFKLSSHFGRKQPEEWGMARLKREIEAGDFVAVGQCIREGVRQNQITDVELEEYAKCNVRPTYSTVSFVKQLEKCNTEDTKNFIVAQHYLSSMKSENGNAVKTLQATVNSMSQSIAKHHHIARLTKRQLEADHLIAPCPPFTKCNLNVLYGRSDLLGENVTVQLTNFITKIWKKMSNPQYEIWRHTFRPSCRREEDRHFAPLPEHIVLAIQDLGLDMRGVYLPPSLLVGPVDTSDEFLHKMDCENPENEVQRRRSLRASALQLINYAIGQSLRVLRTHHFDVPSQKLVTCRNRKVCRTHLQWIDVKMYRENECVPNGKFCSFNPDNLIRSKQKCASEPPLGQHLDYESPTEDRQFEPSTGHFGRPSTSEAMPNYDVDEDYTITDL